MSLMFKKPLIYIPSKKVVKGGAEPEPYSIGTVRYSDYLLKNQDGYDVQDYCFNPNQLFGGNFRIKNKPVSLFRYPSSYDFKVVKLRCKASGSSYDFVDHATNLRWIDHADLTLACPYCLWIPAVNDGKVYKIKNSASSSSDKYSMPITLNSYSITDSTISPSLSWPVSRVNWTNNILQTIQNKLANAGKLYLGALMLCTQSLGNDDLLSLAKFAFGNSQYQFGQKTTVEDFDIGT